MTLINGEWKSNEQSKVLESESITGLKAEKKVSDAEPLVNGNKCVEDVSNTANRQETSASKDFDLNAGAKNRNNYNNAIPDDEYFFDALEEQYMSSEEEQVNGTEGNSERVSIPNKLQTSGAYKVITPTKRKGVLNIDPAPASNNQSGNKKNLKFKSAHSHHLEENIIDNKKNIMQNSSALTEQLFTNDYTGDEMNKDEQRFRESEISDNVENVGADGGSRGVSDGDNQKVHPSLSSSSSLDSASYDKCEGESSTRSSSPEYVDKGSALNLVSNENDDNQDPQLHKLSFAQTKSRQNDNLDKDAEDKRSQELMAASSVSKKNSSSQNGGLDKNNHVSQNTKSNRLGTIAACCALVAGGVALGAAIAVHFEMLAAGIAIGACCMVAAAAVYYYGKPSQSLENSNAQQVTEKLETHL